MVEIQKRMVPATDDDETCHVTNSLLKHMGQQMECLGCEFETVSVDVKHYDLDIGVVVTCDSCEAVLFEEIPACHTDKNLRGVTAGVVSTCMQLGAGYIGLKRYESSVNVGSGVSKQRYYNYMDEIGTRTLDAYETQRPTVNECVGAHYAEQGIPRDDLDVQNIDITYDVTWMTKDHMTWKLTLVCVLTMRYFLITARRVTESEKGSRMMQ